jgi:hypothetical protein
MGLGVGIVLITVGAVMKWGLNADRNEEFNLDTIGTILFVLGILATLISLALWAASAGPRVRRRTVTYDRAGPPVAPAVVPAAAPAPVDSLGRPVYYDASGRPYVLDAGGRPVHTDVAVGAPRRAVVQEEVRDSGL